MSPIQSEERKGNEHDLLFLQGRDEARHDYPHRTVVVIKNVPCMKCEQCGEVVLSADTIEKIERILQTVEKAVAEITVVNFPDCAA